MRTGLMLLLAGCTGEPPPTAPTPEPPACPMFDPGLSLGEVPSPPAVELSGLAVAEDGRVFTHNDSGEGPEIHVLSSTGAFLGTLTLTGVEAVDFEDLAIGPGPDGQDWVWVGDIGDNASSRPSISVYRFPVPSFDQGDIVPERLVLTYPDGARDAETLFVDASSSLWIASKEPDSPTGLYRVLRPAPGVSMLQRMVDLPFGEPPLGQTTLVTGGDLSDEGLVLRTYLTTAYVWPFAEGEEVLSAIDRDPCPVTLMGEAQGEAIAWHPEGLVTVSEGGEPSLNLVPFAP